MPRPPTRPKRKRTGGKAATGRPRARDEGVTHPVKGIQPAGRTNPNERGTQPDKATERPQATPQHDVGGPSEPGRDLFGPFGGPGVVDWLESVGGLPVPEPPPRPGRPPGKPYQPVDVAILASTFKGAFALVAVFVPAWSLTDQQARALAKLWKPLYDYYRLEPSIGMTWMLAIGGTAAVLNTQLQSTVGPLVAAARRRFVQNRKAAPHVPTDIPAAGPAAGSVVRKHDGPGR